jgi:hypothetical protein
MAEDLGTWLYGVTRPLGEGILPPLIGVGGEPVRTVEGSGLAAIVGSVDLVDFGEAGLRRNLEDINWLDACARAHHQVIDAIRQTEPIVPMRLAVVFHDDSGVGAMLDDRHQDLMAALGRIDGRAEWGVKVYADPRSPRGAPDPAPPTSAQGAGTAYLLKRRAQLSAKEQERSALAQSTEDIHATLASLAVASRRHPPQDRRLSGESWSMVLNGAYLLEQAAGEEFVATVRALDERHPGLRLDATGPWPPYSFTFVETEESST